jgi:hypothetical protein
MIRERSSTRSRRQLSAGTGTTSLVFDITAA